jgi:O-antigen/teichoic acid export membrane protein
MLTGLGAQLDVVLLSLVATASSVGTFGVGFQLAIFGAAVPALLTAAILPKFVDAPVDRQQRLIQGALDTLVLLAALVPVLALVFARGVLILLAGRGFAGGTTSLDVLSLYSALAFPATVFIDGLIYLRAEEAVLKAVVAGTAANLLIACVAVPLFGQIAAAAAMAGGNAVFAGVALVLFHRRAPFSLSPRRPVVYAAVAAGLVLAWLLAHGLGHLDASAGWAMLPEMAGLGVVYLGSCALLGARAGARAR